MPTAASRLSGRSGKPRRNSRAARRWTSGNKCRAQKPRTGALTSQPPLPHNTLHASKAGVSQKQNIRKSVYKTIFDKGRVLYSVRFPRRELPPYGINFPCLLLCFFAVNQRLPLHLVWRGAVIHKRPWPAKSVDNLPNFSCIMAGHLIE
jgi:hypothetical protein